MYERAKYKEHSKTQWRSLPDPVAMYKYDGANYFMRVEDDGSLRFFSRRPSVKGHFPERTSALPHLTKDKLPEFAGHVYNVELIHTGKHANGRESHPAVSGILNSLPDKAVATQEATGPIRAVLHNVIHPALPTFKDKLLQMRKVEEAFGKPDLLRVATPHLGLKSIQSLIDQTQRQGTEGVVITSLTLPEHENPRVKIKHQEYYNLVVTGFNEEIDKNGRPKGSLGSLEVADRTGRHVGNVGTGLTPALRREIWQNRQSWLGKVIQVKTMGLARHKLRMPVYNGEADGEVDEVS